MSNMTFLETNCEIGTLFYHSSVFKLKYIPKTCKFRNGQWGKMVLYVKI